MATTNMSGMKQQAERTINNAGRKAEDWADQARGVASDVAGRASDAYDTARDYASDAYDKASDCAANAYDHASTFVKTHPLPSLFAAVGVGVLIGAVCWRQMSHSRY